MKNFKRVISAVIALALSASTLVAVSASRFSDVDNTSYAEAIEVLTALGIVNGYEEEGGFVFKPEGDITRAEAAKMIVGALNMGSDAVANSASSQFTDVNEQAAWSAGYVNVGVTQGFINGYDPTTFGPQDKVTYAQMCKMLTVITGYGEYAEKNGGWPTGYEQMASSSGINKGIAATTNTALKRGQVAQMIYNALTTPLLGVTAYRADGNEYAPMDGSKNSTGFKTLLADKYVGYVADFTIEATPLSDNGLKKNQVKIKVAKDAYLAEDTKTLKSDNVTLTAYDDYGVTDQLFAQGKAIVAQDDNDEWHLVYFKAGSAVETVVLDAADYESKADGGADLDAGKITFGSKDYKINTAAAEIYVNGVKYVTTFNETNVSAVLDKAYGEVKLVDTNSSVSGYETIMATVYTIAKVSGVTYSSANGTRKITIEPKAGTGIGKNTGVYSIEIADDEIEDKTIALTVKNAAGEDVALSTIKKDDIIAFATDVTKPASGTQLKSIDAIDIRVTDEKISGKVTLEDPTDKTITVGDKAYRETVYKKDQYTIGTTYSFSLDPLGRIYDKVSTEDSAYNYGIAERFSDDELMIIRPDGSYKYYEFGPSVKIKDTQNFTGKADANNDVAQSDFRTYIGTASSVKPALQNRVVAYKVQNSNGKINSMELLDTPVSTGAVYKAKSGKLDTKAISSGTGIINVEEYIKTKNYSDYKKFAATSFVDNNKYDAYIFTDPEGNDTKTAAFVMLTSTGKDLTEDSRFAVVRKTYASAQTADGDSCYSLNVLYDGEEQDILCDLSSGVTTLKSGDVIYFKKNAEGLVDSYLKVLDITKYANNDKKAFESTAIFGDTTGSVGGFTFVPGFDGTNTDKDGWNLKNDIQNADNNNIQLVYGIVAETSSNGVTFANIKPTDLIDLNDKTYFKEYSVASDCVCYRYGKGEQSNPANQYKAISVAAPQASNLGNFEDDNISDKYDLNKLSASSINGYDYLVYALAMIVDGDVVALYSIDQQ